MISRYFARPLALLGTGMLSIIGAAPGRSDVLPPDMMVVRYALKLNDWKIVGGESYCRLDQTCHIGFDFDPVRVTLEISSDGPDTVTVSCPVSDSDCELPVQENKHTYFHAERWELFEIFAPQAGRSRDFAIPPRESVGAVLLNYRAGDAAPEDRRGLFHASTAGSGKSSLLALEEIG